MCKWICNGGIVSYSLCSWARGSVSKITSRRRTSNLPKVGSPKVASTKALWKLYESSTKALRKQALQKLSEALWKLYVNSTKAVQKCALQKLSETSTKEGSKKPSESSPKAQRKLHESSTKALWKLSGSSTKSLRKLYESSPKSGLSKSSPKAGWLLLEALQKQADFRWKHSHGKTPQNDQKYFGWVLSQFWKIAYFWSFLRRFPINTARKLKSHSPNWRSTQIKKLKKRN